MSKSTIRNFIIVFVSLAVLGGVAGWSFFNVYQNTHLLEEQIAAVASQREQQNALFQLENIARKSEAERAKLGTYFLGQQSDSIEVLGEVESIAPRLGLRIETQSLTPVAADGLDWMEISFAVEGPRTSIENFLSIMEHIPYVSRVKSISLSGDPGGIWEGRIIIQVQLLNANTES